MEKRAVANMDYYLNRFKSKVSSVAAQVSQALPGNPVFREYEVHEQVASAGPGLSWKIFSGTKNSTKQAVSIWLFEKRQVEKWPKQEKDAFPELLKRGVAQLTRLRHPRLLVVERALEESRETFAFCTEPIFASLANVFTQKDSSVQSHLQDFSFLEVEIRHGLFQLSEALVFLHNDAKILHGNICPSSIVINEKGAWKLSGFDFCVLGTPLSSGQVTFEISEWDRRLMSCMNPELDFAAPELVQGVKCDTYADIFSLGIIMCTLFNDNKPLFESKGLLDEYRKNAEKLKQMSGDTFRRIPDVLKEDAKASLNVTPELRPDAIQLTKIAYFDDSLLKIFNYLDSLMQMDNSQKMQFFKGLPSILNKFPKRPLLQKVFPYLAAELTNVDLVPFILPNVFTISESTRNKEFASVIFPALIPVFAMQRPYQTVLLLLQNIPLFLQKAPDGDVRKHVLPLIYNSLSNENPKIQELCLTIIPAIGKLVDRDAMKTQLLPKLLRIIIEANFLSIRVQTLVCLSKLMMNLEQWMVADQILPALPKINSKEPAILMAVLGIYKLAFEAEKFGISTDQCAKSVLPFLVSSCVENSLNLQQFEQYSALIHKILEKVEKEQRQRLQKLSASQEEQRNINFSEILSSAASAGVDAAPKLDADLSGLCDVFSSASTATKGSSNGTTMDAFPFSLGNPMPITSSSMNKGLMSLDEKKRLAAEQERNLQSRSTPISGAQSAKVTNGNGGTSSFRNSPILTSPSMQTPATGTTAAAPMNDLFTADFSALSSTVPTTTTSASCASSGNDGPGSQNQLNLDDFAAWTMSSSGSNETKNVSNCAFANFPQPPSNSGNLVQRSSANTSGLISGGNESLDDLFNGLGSAFTTRKPAQHTAVHSQNPIGASGGRGPMISNPAWPIGLQSMLQQPQNRSVPDFQTANFNAFDSLISSSMKTRNISKKDPFEDLLR